MTAIWPHGSHYIVAVAVAKATAGDRVVSDAANGGIGAIAETGTTIAQNNAC